MNSVAAILAGNRWGISALWLWDFNTIEQPAVLWLTAHAVTKHHTDQSVMAVTAPENVSPFCV